MDWDTDGGLQLRMVLALALVAVMPLAFVTTMAWSLNAMVFPLAERLLAVRVSRVGVPVVGVIALTVGGLGLTYLAGGRFALRSVGARRVEESARPELHARLERLAGTAGVQSPDVAVIDSAVPNAFATGRSPADATVAVSEGLVETLDDDELDAVLAHELAHVRNRDAAVMTVAYLLPTFTYHVAHGAYVVLSVVGKGITHVRSSDSDDARAVLAMIVLFVVTTIVTITVSAVFWAASFLLFRLLSRYREYAADRGAAAITGDPLALATALDEIDEEMQALPDRDLRELDGGVEALYVSSLDLPMFTDDDPALLSQDVFPESHPPTDERIERLQELSEELERRATAFAPDDMSGGSKNT